MKSMFKFPVFVLGLILLLAGSTITASAQDDDVSLQTFYDELSPYGTWIQDSQYGYVWRPDVDQADFRPYYTDGRWVMTEYGNTWVSNYDWGWAPFHYGRWVNNSYNEWVWIPDTTWGPAWVSWRSGGGYYGWAPLGPGININVNFGGGYNIPHSWWVFVPQGNIYYDRFPRYRSYININIFNRTNYINYTGQRNRSTYFTGPRRDDIRRATNRDVTVYRVNRTDRSGRSTITNNTVNIYNPRGGGRNVDNKNARPGRVSTERDYAANRGNQPARNNAGRDNNAGRNVGANAGRTNRDAVNRTQTGQRNEAIQRSQRERTQNQTQQRDQATRQQQVQQRTQRETQERGQQAQTQQREQAVRQQQAEQQRTQREAQERGQQAQTQQREHAVRQQQAEQQRTQREAQERGQAAQTQQREQAARQQQAQQQRTQQQQQRAQEQSRQQAQPRAQVQQQRQERVQQSAPSRSNERGSSGQS
ncbi:DUF6600 domain-containing protein, partial [Pedobacter sp.]|uniref:DUF6600 domain-containing protein n=1 Tax=Pedobacter sp. TaxID=1411316 RepID=UPI003D7FDEC0